MATAPGRVVPDRRPVSRTTTSGSPSSAELAAGADPASLSLGDERRPLTSLWDGLECFAVHDATPEPAPLAAAVDRDARHRPPDAAGLVDHGRIGDAWERSRGSVSIVALLLEELT